MISIDRLRVANILFAERDYYEEAYNACSEISSIKDITISKQDSLNTLLTIKIDNLSDIIAHQDTIIDFERDKLQALAKKCRKEKFTIMGVSGAFILLLILL